MFIYLKVTSIYLSSQSKKSSTISHSAPHLKFEGDFKVIVENHLTNTSQINSL